MNNNLSILIVEDEALTALFMTTMLKQKGYNPLKCISSGEEAVVFALENKPDLVLMDIRLAGKMNGIEAVIKIKENLPGSLMQFIFTTGYSDDDYREKSMELQPLGFFIKPVNTSELIDLIESHFKK